ncbi:MAG: hypothetical protein QG597_3473 [Actinomycetota bacterium]|nr:hypothetical protein [Actinomycetota bacterium]
MVEGPAEPGRRFSEDRCEHVAAAVGEDSLDELRTGGVPKVGEREGSEMHARPVIDVRHRARPRRRGYAGQEIAVCPGEWHEKEPGIPLFITSPSHNAIATFRRNPSALTDRVGVRQNRTHSGGNRGVLVLLFDGQECCHTSHAPDVCRNSTVGTTAAVKAEDAAFWMLVLVESEVSERRADAVPPTG